MAGKLFAAIAGRSKQKMIPAKVIDILGNRCSVRLSSRGSKLTGVPYIGTTPAVGDTVYVDYKNGSPFVLAISSSLSTEAPSLITAIPTSQISPSQTNPAETISQPGMLEDLVSAEALRLVITDSNGAVGTLDWLSLTTTQRQIILGNLEVPPTLAAGVAMHVLDSSGHTGGEIFLHAQGRGLGATYPDDYLPEEFAGRFYFIRTGGDSDAQTGVLENYVLGEIAAVGLMEDEDGVTGYTTAEEEAIGEPPSFTPGTRRIEHAHAAAIKIIADGNFLRAPSVNSRPTRIEFLTTPVGVDDSIPSSNLTFRIKNSFVSSFVPLDIPETASPGIPPVGFGRLWVNPTNKHYMFTDSDGLDTDLFSGSGGLADGDYGDIIVSGSGTVMSFLARQTFDESSSIAGVHAGINSSTPRIMFADGDDTRNWQIDNYLGVFRWFLPGVEHMLLSSTELNLPGKNLEVGGDGHFTGDLTVDGDIIGLENVDNTSDADKPVSTAQAAADAVVLASAETYTDGLVVGLWNDRGNFDASGGAYPSSGGSGPAGAIKKGNIWTISVTGTLPTGQVVEVGDVVRALVNSATNAQADWAIVQNNIGYVAENSANKTDIMAGNTTSSTKYLSAKGVYDWAVGLFQQLNANLTAIAGLTSAADKGIQFTGTGTAATYDLTTAGKALLDDADSGTQLTTLGIGASMTTATPNDSDVFPYHQNSHVPTRTRGATWAVIKSTLASLFLTKLTADTTYYVCSPQVAVTITIATPGVITWTAHGLPANAAVKFAIPRNIAAATVTIATPGVVTKTSHGYSAGQPFFFETTGALPTGIVGGTTYFVIATGLTANTFQFAATVGGAAINTTGSQSGTHGVGETGTFPTGLTGGVIYYVVGASITANTFQVSATAGGAAINTTGSTNGTIRAQSGSDSNDGLTNSISGSFLTLQAAIDVVKILNTQSYNVTIQVADGNHGTGGIISNDLLGSGTLTIQGNSTHPENCLIAPSSGNAIYASDGAVVQVNDVEIRGGRGLVGDRHGTIKYQNVRFGPCTTDQILAQDAGEVVATGNYYIVGSAARHINYVDGVIRIISITITLIGIPAFSTEFIEGSLCGGCSSFSLAFIGTATGKRYSILTNAAMNTVGGGANYFPGNSAGTTDGFGVYS